MFKKTLAALALALALPAVVAAPVQTARGQVDVAAPKKVVAFDVGVIDSLDALGVKLAGMPMPSKISPPSLAASQKGAQDVGTLFEPNLEALSALQPDLIIVAARTATKHDQLKRLAPTIDLTLNNSNLYAQSLQRLSDLGQVFGKQKEAQAWASKLNRLRDETRAAAAGQGKVLAILVNGPKLSIYGKDSRIGWVEQTLGLQLIDKAKPVGANHGNPISFEFIAQADPDWIFVIDRAAVVTGQNLQAAQVVLDTPLVKNTKAGKSGRILYLSPNDIYINIGGPQALHNTLTQLRDAFKARPVR